jgi:hypothetical protein
MAKFIDLIRVTEIMAETITLAMRGEVQIVIIVGTMCHTILGTLKMRRTSRIWSHAPTV